MRNRWLTRRAVTLHLAAIFAVATCLALGWWQLQRATGGNQLSWAYTVEWPFFAGYAAWVWWKLLHEEPEFARPGKDRVAKAERDMERAIAAYRDDLAAREEEERARGE